MCSETPATDAVRGATSAAQDRNEPALCRGPAVMVLLQKSVDAGARICKPRHCLRNCICMAIADAHSIMRVSAYLNTLVMAMGF